jgi:ADP-ribose pyrophosphatase YjhB (NUDIX family)
MSLANTEFLPKSYEHLTDDEFKQYSLEALAVNLTRKQTPGYPSQSQRLVMNEPFYNEKGLIEFPTNGPWEVGQILPTHEERTGEVLSMTGYPKGYTLDYEWRPLHPWWQQMLTRPDIGAVVGKGFYYHWGANYTADAAVTAHLSDGSTKLLLIKRSDTGDWALPGGFVDEYEHTQNAAIRELQEETGLVISHDSLAQCIYNGPVVDIRTTIHAWAETSLWKFDISAESLPVVTGSDDAALAKWFDITKLPSELYGSHAVLIAKALEN